MNLTISPISMNSFKGDKPPVENKNSQKVVNPISRAGEAAKLAKATFVAGMGLGCKVLFELLDGDFLFEHVGKTASDLVDKNKQIINPTKKFLCKAGGTLGLIVGAIGLFAAAYTLYKTPNIAYESKINTFKKGNDMDVFIKSNEAQKGIYEQMNAQAQNANEKEKEELKGLYAKMQMAHAKA